MNSELNTTLQAEEERDDRVCASCGQGTVTTSLVEDSFPYGVGAGAVTLTVVVPLRTCPECGCSYYDYVTEDLRHEAVCRHLGVMTPAEIVALRSRYGLSRDAFAQLTKLGTATIARWERGALVQNAANDQLLYLLTFPENVDRLRERNRLPTETTPAARPSAGTSYQLDPSARADSPLAGAPGS